MRRPPGRPGIRTAGRRRPIPATSAGAWRRGGPNCGSASARSPSAPRSNRRYLEYLENFAGQPDAGTLRRLAAALRTTPAALLGAGGDGAARPRVPGPVGQLERLSLAECHRLLAPGGLGRLAFTTVSGLMVLPVNYLLVAGTIVLRTGTGSLIAAHGDDPVSFETDHLD